MPPVNRNKPKRAKSSESSYTLMDFAREFPDDATCLEFLWRRNHSPDSQHAHCPKCKRDRGFSKLAQHPAYSCNTCGHHVHPTAGTIFHKSSTSLALWFHAIFLMSQTRCGISAKQLERDLGVTYKTAWRMFNKIRSMLAQDDDEPLSGEVEVDETYVGGKPRAADIRRHRESPHPKQAGMKWADETKTMVFGMVERGGRVRATVEPKSRGLTFKGTVAEHVLPSAMIFTDEHAAYKGLDKRYRGHQRIRHQANVYVDGNVHTQTIEGFFSLMKNGIRGVYHSVSTKHLQSYLDEYAFRYNHRRDHQPMFELLLSRAIRSTV